jgi:hypothetical protein
MTSARTAQSCVHHYVMPTVGLTVTGVCKFCGAAREFSNIPVEAETLHEQKVRAARRRGKAPQIPARRDHPWVMPI